MFLDASSGTKTTHNSRWSLRVQSVIFKPKFVKSITDRSVLPYPFSRRTIDFGDPTFEVVRVAPQQLLQHSDQGKQCYDLYTELYQYCLNS